MKLLFIHPNIESSDPLILSLQATGIVVLIANTADKAKQLLTAHALSLEIAVIHREPFGLDLIPVIKASQALSDLPYVITSSEWSEADFKNHQGGPDGANAYLRYEECESRLKAVLEQVLGGELSLDQSVLEEGLSSASISKLTVAGKGVPLSDLSSLPESAEITFSIEDPLDVFGSGESTPTSGSFVLEVDSEANPASGGTVPVGEMNLISNPEPQEVTAALIAGDPNSLPLAEVASGASEGAIVSTGGPEFNLAEIPVVPVAQESSEAPQESQSIHLESIQEAPIDLSLKQEEVVLEQPLPEASASLEAALPVDELDSELPYLANQQSIPRPSSFIGDAIVPGGAVQSPDLETLKRYLNLREQDVAALSAQLHDAKTQIKKLESDLRQSHFLMEEQMFQLEGKIKREEEFEKEKALLSDGLQSEIEELRFQMKTRADKARALESQVREANQEIERLKERVRNDIRKIRVREKELENRLELIKKDSDALLVAREATIIDLKRKLDTAEFNLDLMQDRLSKEKDHSSELREKLLRASQAVRLAGGLLDPPQANAESKSSNEKSPGKSERKVS